MYETIKRIYMHTGNQEAVFKAEQKGWITEKETEEILGTTIAPEETPE